MSGHPTVPVQLPRPVTAIEIDAEIAGVIAQCWRIGLRTKHSCQGGPGSSIENHPRASLAYVSFESFGEALIFAAVAGPLAWDDKAHAKRLQEAPPFDEGPRFGWRVEKQSPVVRFPNRDIKRAHRVLARCADAVFDDRSRPRGARKRK